MPHGNARPVTSSQGNGDAATAANCRHCTSLPPSSQAARPTEPRGLLDQPPQTAATPPVVSDSARPSRTSTALRRAASETSCRRLIIMARVAGNSTAPAAYIAQGARTCLVLPYQQIWTSALTGSCIARQEGQPGAQGTKACACKRKDVRREALNDEAKAAAVLGAQQTHL